MDVQQVGGIIERRYGLSEKDLCEDGRDLWKDASSQVNRASLSYQYHSVTDKTFSTLSQIEDWTILAR